MRTITIWLEVPDDVRVRVVGVPDEGAVLPLPEGTTESNGSAMRAAPTVAALDRGSLSGVCPVHRIPWRVVPAGVSRRTGRPYDAFRACAETGCEEKPR